MAALGAGAFLFDVTLRLRLPRDADYAEAAAALRVRAGPSDAVQVWPAWAERARMFIRAVPVRAEEDLSAADYPAVQRLWLLSLPRVPFAHLDRAREALHARGAVAGEAARFGALTLEPWELYGPRVLSFLTSPAEEHEVDYVARQCTQVRIGPVTAPARLDARGSGGVLHVRAGVIGGSAVPYASRWSSTAGRSASSSCQRPCRRSPGGVASTLRSQRASTRSRSS